MPQSAPGRRRRPPVLSVALAVSGVLMLAGCGEDPAITEQDPDSGPIGDPGGEQQLSAPDPQGEQLSHEEMRDALEEHVSGAGITDTDDLLPGLRDLETELQRLVVDPQECKQYVVESASPLPDGALMAHAVQGGSAGEEDPEDEGDSDDSDDADPADSAAETLEATVYSFADWESAEALLSGERDGADLCDSYTASRGSGEEDEDSLDTEVSLEEIPLSSAADGALGLAQEITADGSASHLVAVMLRQGSQVVLVAEGVDEEPDEDEAEDLGEQLQEQAAAVLSDLTGDDLALEDEDDDDGDEDDEDDDAEPDADDGGDDDSGEDSGEDDS